MKKIMLLVVLLFIGTKLWSKPVGLENCLKTYMLNAFIQLVYQIDPFIDILSKPQDVYKEYTLGYAFQHLVQDIRKAQEDNKSIECEFQGNSTNLKKFTHLVYSHMHFSAGGVASLHRTFIEIMMKFGKSSSEKLDSILNVSLEQIINIPNYSVSSKKFLQTPFFILEGTGNIENDIGEFFDPKKPSDHFQDPLARAQPYEVFRALKFLSVPKFLVFLSQSHDVPSNFPDELDLTPYIEGHSQALYQLRSITSYIPVGNVGIYRAVVRDRDGKLYMCNNDTIKQVSSWQEESIGTSNLFLYVLETNISAADDLKDKLVKLEQSLNNLKLVLTK